MLLFSIVSVCSQSAFRGSQEDTDSRGGIGGGAGFCRGRMWACMD